MQQFSETIYEFQATIDETRAVLDEHRLKDHTPEYEQKLRELPPRPWGSIPRRLELSRCDVCNMLMHHIVDLASASPFKIVLSLPVTK